MENADRILEIISGEMTTHVPAHNEKLYKIRKRLGVHRIEDPLCLKS